MVKPEKSVVWPKEYHHDAKHDQGSGWERGSRGTVLYQQPAIGDKGSGASGEGTLDGRKLSLAARCDVPRGWEPYAGKASLVSFKHHAKTFIKSIKNDGDRKKGVKHEKETICNRDKHRKISGADHESVKFLQTI